jgi:hypothetical protein
MLSVIASSGDTHKHIYQDDVDDDYSYGHDELQAAVHASPSSSHLLLLVPARLSSPGNRAIHNVIGNQEKGLELQVSERNEL